MYLKHPLLCVAGSYVSWRQCGRSWELHPDHLPTAAHRVFHLLPLLQFLHCLCMFQESPQSQKEMVSCVAYVEDRGLVQSTDLGLLLE
jgi:hypothetical protein